MACSLYYMIHGRRAAYVRKVQRVARSAAAPLTAPPGITSHDRHASLAARAALAVAGHRRTRALRAAHRHPRPTAGAQWPGTNSTPRLPATFASWRRSARAAPPAPAAECYRSPPSRSRPCSPRRRNRRPPAHDAAVRERCGVCMADTWHAPAARHQSCSRRAPWPRAEGSSG